MRLATFKLQDGRRIGLVPTAAEGKVYDISSLAGSADMADLIQNADEILPVLRNLEHRIMEEGLLERLANLRDVELCSPIMRPGKIVCLAGNYRAHIAESGYVEPGEQARFTQQLFLKPSTSLVGDRGVIELGGQNVKVGWETELAVVIGKRGRNIREERAYEHVFGYTILNDLSERGLNSRIKNRHLREMDGFCDWLAGKWFDGFAPCGPWIVTKDEIPDPQNLEIKFFLNGELRQKGSTMDMIFNIPAQLAYISSIMTLEPGDIISTGTPAGAGLGDKATAFADGDEFVSEIEGIGKLTNKVRWVD